MKLNRRNFLKYFTGGLLGVGLVPMVGVSDSESITVEQLRACRDIIWRNKPIVYGKIKPTTDEGILERVRQDLCKAMDDAIDDELINSGKYYLIKERAWQ